MLYFAGVRLLGEETYIETWECYEHQFQSLLQRAAIIQRRVSKRVFVDFRARPHTFEIKDDGEPHLLTPAKPISIGPTATFLETGD